MEKYERELNDKIKFKMVSDNIFCIYGNEDSSNYFIEIDKLLKILSEIKYNDEWFIEKSILSYKAQKEKTYTFYRNDNFKDEIEKYNWCQRPCDSNMSLRKFEKNATICGYMSESLAEEHGLEQIDLDTFIWKFVQPILEENIKLKEKWNKDTHTLQNQLDLANADRVEKDKIIDLMAEDIFNYKCLTYVDDRQFRACKKGIIGEYKEKAREENE